MTTETQEAIALPFHPELKVRVEDFLAYEAELLDERQFDRWLDLLDDDIHYWMPLVRNFEFNRPQDEYSRAHLDAAWFDEGKQTLLQRIRQIQGGDHWAEEPLSRSTHMTTNIRVAAVTETQITVKCRFLLYVNRREEEVRLFVGKRTDILRPVGDGFRILKRSIFLDQSKMLFKNLTTFF
ncbi:3-phenylpropionate/cinnamic acid dioxygenase subunit beta [Niveispirillum sp.]|uniref:3-phenylpropionate/cinnamic acid dioxygenase subunit beta n=1 Tax=Niveispirillum sp. TaxID=1917217 RepID=UPI001B58EB8F|nr:3-phenylpropionate/cinnamic acid dioxygenase subunit beta [Niveispirillum sp.]MBP7336523.1 3-phenylpropionate/cinnamic acid dioxygenase subunit beta [Niveispirillum sp.]